MAKCITSVNMRLTARLFNSLPLKKRSFYITTPIFYVNASPHIGHLYSAVIADTVQRFERLINPDSSIIFTTGTDEHGIKIQLAAEKNKKLINHYCDDISMQYKTLFENSGVQFTDFIRTTEDRHKEAVQHFWNQLMKHDLIYKSEYSSWYCVSDETFLTEAHVKEEIRNGEKIMISCESGHPVEWTKEENYMFKLSTFKNDLEYWLKQKGVIRPHKFQEILRNYLNDHSLPDISISRPSSRVHWAIGVPDDPSQSIYVWLDALINYLTVLGYPKCSNDELLLNWPADVQVVGKDILKFHGLYWPAFLLAVGLNPPKRILCHGHWTVDGKKMSKSLNNVVDPNNIVCSLEALRYFLLREGTMHSDANYSTLKMSRILNSELADTLGNLLNRCTSSRLNPDSEVPGLHADVFENIKNNDIGKALIENTETLSTTCRHHYENFHFYKAVDQVMSVLHLANEFVNHRKPWLLIKSSDKRKELDVVLHITLEAIRVCSIVLMPVIPNMSNRLLDKLSVPKESRLWEDAASVTWQRDPNIPKRAISDENFLFFDKIVLEKDENVKKAQRV